MVSRVRVAVLVLLGALSAPLRGAEDADAKLDLSLRLVRRMQAEAARGLRPRTDGAALLRRLRGLPGGKGATGADGLLSVLVRHDGPTAALRGAGLRVDACVGTICTGTLRASRLDGLLALPGIRAVHGAQRWSAMGRAGGGPAFAAAVRARRAEADAGGTGTLVAFVDTGVDFRHHDFRKADGATRIKYLLDLSDPGDVNGDGRLDGTGPYGGTLHTESQINAALAGGAAIGERDTTGHGTHGLSIAAGDESPPGLAPAADLVVVKATREDGTLGFVSTDVVNALAFVDQKARELGRPLVVNLSLGTIVGSHDGRSLEEQAIDQMTGPGIPGRVAVIAAGNSSDNRAARYRHLQDRALVGLARTHALTVPAYTPSPGQGDDRVLIDVWYPGRDKLTVRLTSPGGTTVSAPFGQYVDEETTEGNVFIANLGGASLENGDIEAMVLVDDWSGTAPAPGTWTITFEGEEVGDAGEYHAWLSDDSAVGSAAPWLSANADNRYLVGRPGTSFNGVTVGSYAWHDPSSRYRVSWTDASGIARTDTSAVVGELSDFSSPGGTRDGRLKPDLTAPGERVLGAVSADAWPGVSATSIYRYHGFPEPDALLTSGEPDRAYGLLQGTSFSAPVVTGLAARVLSASPTLDAIQVRNVLVNAATADAFTGAVPNEEWGWGKAALSLGSGGGPLPSSLRVETHELPAGYVDEAYQLVLMASGGRLPYAWSVSAGELPPGLTLDVHGLISGRPLSPGSYQVTVSVTDASSPPQAAARILRLSVSDEPPLEILTAVLPPGRLDADYDQDLEGRGGVPPYTWSLAGGALPAGLQLSPAGRVSGVPSAVGRFHFTVRLADATAASVYGAVRIHVVRDPSDYWQLLGTLDTEITRLAVDPNDTRRLFAGTDNTFDPSQNTVYESVDGGERWRPVSVNNGFFDAENFDGITWLAVSPADSRAWATHEGGGGGRVLRYDGAARVWDTTLVGCRDPSIVDFDAAGVLYLSCASTRDFRRSTDNGGSWQVIGQMCGDELIFGGGLKGSLSVYRADPSRMYAIHHGITGGTSATFTCRSTDGGATWVELGRRLAPSDSYLEVQVSQSNPDDVVRVVVEVDGLYVERSLNGGLTWSRTKPAVQGSLRSFRRSPSDPAVILYGSDRGLFRSLDHGQTWAPVPVKGFSTLGVTSIAFDPTDATRFYVGSTRGLFYTGDGGATWSQKNRGLVRRPLNGMSMSRQAPNEVLLAGTGGKTYLSRTTGDKWTVGTSLSSFDVLFPVISGADPSLYYVVAELSGVYRSQNRGLDWKAVSMSIPFGTVVEFLSADPLDADNLLIWVSGNAVYRSTDRGDTWAQVANPGFVGPKNLAYAHDVPDRVFGAWAWDGVFRSSDGGVTWQGYGFNGKTVSIGLVMPAPSDSDYVYAAGAVMYYRDPANPGTDPAIAPWRAASVSPSRPVLCLTVDWANPRLAYAGVDHPGVPGGIGGIWRTTNGGATWTRLPGPLDAFDVVSIAVHPTDPATVLAATAEGGVYRTRDGGETWTALDSYGSVGEVVNVTVKHPTQALLFAGTEGYGVQVSSNDGQTFSARNTGLGSLNVNALAFEPGSATVLYAATDAGIYKSTNTGNGWASTALSLGEVTDLVTDNEGTARRIWGTVRGEGVAYSANGGTTFGVHSSGLASLELTSLHLETVGTARRIWGTTRGGDGVVYSDDLGQTWQSAAGAGLTDRDVNDFTTESGAARRIWGTARRIWGTTDSGPFYSDDDGKSWSELSLGLPSGVPVSSVSIDPKTNEVLVSLFSDREGGVFRGANLNGIWRSFNDGLESLKVRRVTNDGGRTIDATTTATTFYAATAGDGAYANEIRNTVAPAPGITTTTLPAGRLRVAYSATLSASGGVAPLAWSVPEGYLPTGLVLDPLSGAISGVPGQVGTFTFSVQVADAQSRLDRESFSIVVSDPRPTIAAADLTVAEGNAGTRDAVFTVTLSSATEETVTVAYSTEDGTATAGPDYLARSGLLSFAPGVLSRPVSVPIVGDRMREGAETFFLELSGAANARLSRERIQATIRDDDVPPNDWDGDGRSDLLWSHAVIGTLQSWLLEGTSAKSSSVLTPARPSDPGWQVRALLDFDGDGWTDVLWQHVQSGELYAWLLEGTVRRSGAYLAPRSLADRSWVVRAAGDFDGDGYPDLLWHHQKTGALAVWLMTGTALKQSVTPSPGAMSDVRWQVRAVSDFDGDGQADVLWHHQKTGALLVWKMDGTTRSATLSVVPGAISDVKWKIASVVDFDGDGGVDVLWHHQLTGELRVWRMDGLARTGEAAFAPSHQDPAWRLAPRWDVVLPATVRRTRRK